MLSNRCFQHEWCNLRLENLFRLPILQEVPVIEAERQRGREGETEAEVDKQVRVQILYSPDSHGHGNRLTF